LPSPTCHCADRLETVDEPRKEWALHMTIAAAPRSGTVAASLLDAVRPQSGSCATSRFVLSPGERTHAALALL
jgi:hypothetical protein